jgi:hypothetical protein
VVDIIDVKTALGCGELTTKINRFGSILLEDLKSGEAIIIGKLPDNYSFHPMATWHPTTIHDYDNSDGSVKSREGYVCSNCGRTAYERYDWCNCGADMRRKPIKLNKGIYKMLEDF